MKRYAKHRLSAAFTLVELLVVIAIIVILMSLLLTAVPAVKEAARKAEAKNTANMVVTAINSYYTEYARFPPTEDPNKESETTTAADDLVVGDPDMGASLPNNTVFYTLRNIPKGPNDAYISNPRKVVFYEGKAANVNSSGRARGGFFDKTSSGSNPPPAEESCLFDPWGNQYGIIFDASGDDRIDMKSYYVDFTGVDESGKAPRRKAGAFSMGKDEKLGNKGDKTYRNGTELSDDVVTWE